MNVTVKNNIIYCFFIYFNYVLSDFLYFNKYNFYPTLFSVISILENVNVSIYYIINIMDSKYTWISYYYIL